MTDTLDPKDLLRYQTAQQEAAQAQQRALEAQRVANEAADAFKAAAGAAQFVNRELAQAYALQPGDHVHPQTGAITRKAQAEQAVLAQAEDILRREGVPKRKR